MHLVGTMTSDTLSGAVLIGPDGSQSFYRLHELLPDGSQLIQVQSGSIFIKYSDGTRGELFVMHGSGPSHQQSGPQPRPAGAQPAIPHVSDQAGPATPYGPNSINPDTSTTEETRSPRKNPSSGIKRPGLLSG